MGEPISDDVLIDVLKARGYNVRKKDDAALAQRVEAL
jgi:hypothetical protein